MNIALPEQSPCALPHEPAPHTRSNAHGSTVPGLELAPFGLLSGQASFLLFVLSQDGLIGLSQCAALHDDSLQTNEK
jgi:hypothetical protein